MKPLRETERRALRELLADDDPRALALLEEQFARMGEPGCEFLEAVCEAGNPAAKRGAQQILDTIRERKARGGWEQFCKECTNDCNLEDGCWWLARTRYWHLDVPRYRARLDEMAQ